MPGSTSKLLEKLEEGRQLSMRGVKAALKDLKEQIHKMLVNRAVYSVVDVAVEYNDGTPALETRISGNQLRLAAWLHETASRPNVEKFKFKVVEFSTDRNWARGKGTEV